MKSHGIPVYANKIDYIVNAPLQEVIPKLFWISYDLEYNHNITSCEFYSDGEGSSFTTHFILYLISKLAGIFQEREICAKFHHFKISEELYVITQDHCDIIPLNKKYIRVTMYLSGIQFKALSPTTTQVTRIFHGDMNGAIPKCKLFFLATFFSQKTFNFLGIINSVAKKHVNANIKVKQILDAGNYQVKTYELQPLPNSLHQ